MAASRTVVKNTFLEVVVEGDTNRAAACRSKSARPAAAAVAPEEESENFVSQLSRLGDVFSSQGRKSLVDMSMRLPEGHWKMPKTACGLKPSQSNNSVSTMARSDWYDEDDSEEACVGIQQPADLEPQVAAVPADGPSAQPTRVQRGTFQHSMVPRTQNLAQEFLKMPNTTAPSTVMLRNIPNRYTQKELIAELGSLGFEGSFDFLYLPIDTGSMGNVGYAFVNFVDSSWASRCFDVIAGHTFTRHQQKTRTKVATVSGAHLQGLEANMRHYERTAVNARGRSKRCGPVVLANLAASYRST